MNPSPWTGGGGSGSLLFQGALTSGELLFLQRETILDASRPELYRPDEPLLAYGPSGEGPRLLATVPGREQYRAPGRRSGVAGFARETIVAASKAVYAIGSTDAPFIRVITPDGERVLELPYEVQVPTAGQRRAERARLRVEQRRQFRGLPPNFLAEREAYADEVLFAGSLPVFDRLLIADSGEIWVRRFDPDTPESDDRVQWLLFGPRGSHFGVVSLPRSSELLAVADSRALVLHPDESGAESVRLYRVVEGMPERQR